MAEAEQLWAQVIDFLRMLPGSVLLVTYKQAEAVLKPHLPAHVEIAHFGAIRGLNNFERFKTAVVIGRPQPSPQDLETQTRPFTADDSRPFLPVGEYVTQPRGRRMRDAEAPNVVAVQVHSDTRCQARLEQMREGEIAQAVDRVRPVFNRRRIFILSDLALDVTVDRVMPWPALRPSKFVHALTRHGVLPLSAGDMAAAFPDLWRDRKAAEEALRCDAKTTGKSQIDILFGKTRLFFPGFLKATYRRQNQRGPLSRSLVRPDLADPRAALQGLVGELVEFHVERPPEALAQVQATLLAITAVACGEVRAPAPAPAPKPPKPLPPLPPLAAALSAEAHLLATGDPMARPHDSLGLSGVMKIMRLTAQTHQPLPRLAAA